MGETAKRWQGLLQTVVETNGDIVSSKRLKGHLDTFAEKNPLLREVMVTEGKVELREGFPEDEGGLKTVATVIGVLYWTLVDMHTEPAAASERIRRPIRDYIEKNLPPGTVIGLNKHLPKLQLEGESGAGPPAGPNQTQERSGAGAGILDGRPAPTAAALPLTQESDGQRELWERSAGPAPEGASPAANAAAVGGAATAELPGEAPAAQFPGTVPWLGENIPRGCSLLVEGHGGAKEEVALRFLGEGLSAGESVLALIACSPDDFRQRLKALGYETKKAEESGRFKILDWSTFRERHIDDFEDDGPVLRLPMELTSVNPAVNMGLSGLPDSGSPRAFVNILPRALATVAIETVFNFVQVTILKFKRRKMTGIFIMEEETDPEKAAIRLSFNSWLEVGESPGGKYSVRLGGPILRPKLKTVSFSGGSWVVENEEAIAPEPSEAPGPPVPGELLMQVSEWRALGFDVSGLERALKRDPERARSALEKFGDTVSRLKTIRDDLRILDFGGYESDAAAIQDMLLDVDRVEQAERAHELLRQKLDRKRAAARERAGPAGGAAAPAGPPEPPASKGPDPGARAAVAGELLGTAEARRREKLRREQEAVRGAQEQARLREEAERRSREAAAGEDKRREFKEFVARCKQDGYVVAPLEAKLDSDLDSLRRDLLLFRVQLPRLRELGEELAAIEAPALDKRKAELSAMLTDVARIPDLEKGLERLRSESARLNDEDRTRREEEQRRRAALSEKLFWWSSHGLPVEGLEKLLDGDQAAAEREFSIYEARATRLLGLKDELAAMDTTGFRDQAAALEAVLGDVEHVERAEAEFSAFRDLLARHSTEAVERKSLDERLLGWKAKGFRVETVESALQGDIGAAREGLSRFEERARAAEAISAQLPQLDQKGFEDRVRQLGEMLPDTSRLEECQGLLLAIRSDQERARAEALERAEYRRRIGEWKKGGLGTGPLEALLDRDLSALRKAAVAFQFDVDAYDDMLSQLEPLLRSRHAEEAARLQKELKDFSRLGELEEKVAALRSGAESEAVASARELGREFDTDIALMEKVRGWVSSGMTVRRLEGALRHERDNWRAEMEGLEREIEDLSKETSALEVLDTKGHEADIQHIRSMLNDPDNLPLVRAYRDALRSRIARRKKEGERKAALSEVAGEWERKGHRVKQLTEALDRDLEKASQQFVLFRTRMSASEHLRRRLDALALFAGESELERLRRRLDETDNPAEVRADVDRLWKAAEERGREKAARRKAAQQRKRALRERIMGWLEKGMSVRRLERALELAPDESEKEILRFEEDVRRLRALGERIAALASPAFEPELAVLRSRLDDVDSIPEIEKGLLALAERAERARLEEDARLQAERARLHEQELQGASRRRLEERLKLWSGSGYNVEPLRAALAADTSLAEKRFSEFESAIKRSEELRARLHAIQARGPEGVPGAETIEKMLQDPLKLPQAEKAFADFGRRAETALLANDAEMQRFQERIRELGSKGEDVSSLERAWNKGLAEVRQAFADFDRELVKRERMETWRGIKSRLLSGPSAAAGDAGQGTAGPGSGKGAVGRPENGAEGPEGDGAGGARSSKRKIRKLKK